MNRIIPPRIKAGDEILIVAPSLAFSFLEDDIIQRAKEKLEAMGFVVSFSSLCHPNMDRAKTDSSYYRAKDLEEAFLDKNVKGILTALGGFDCHTILEHLDFSIIENNPKVLCGHSDITSLQNAILEKTGLITYSGPHFSTFGVNNVVDIKYTEEAFLQAVATNGWYQWKEAKQWGSYDGQEDSNATMYEDIYNNEGMVVICKGNRIREENSHSETFEGRVIGGNLRTLMNIATTSYMPSMEDSILFIEDDNLSGGDFVREFFMNLQGLMNIDGFSRLKGIVIGRSKDQSLRNHLHLLGKFFEGNPLFSHMVLLYGADFGHTSPMGTFPIGGDCRVEIVDNQAKLWVKC